MLALGDQTNWGSANQTGETNPRGKVLEETASGVIREDKLEVLGLRRLKGERQRNIPDSRKGKAASWR